MRQSLERERAAFHRAHLAWASGDLHDFLSLLADDIVYTVNVDGLEVPYASSAVGKEDVRWRLELLLDTFEVVTFHMESLTHEAGFSRSTVRGRYIHKATGEILDVRIRFRAWLKDGHIVRMEEVHDAAYVVAFQRFVKHLATAAAKRR